MPSEAHRYEESFTQSVADKRAGGRRTQARAACRLMLPEGAGGRSPPLFATHDCSSHPCGPVPVSRASALTHPPACWQDWSTNGYHGTCYNSPTFNGDYMELTKVGRRHDHSGGDGRGWHP